MISAAEARQHLPRDPVDPVAAAAEPGAGARSSRPGPACLPRLRSRKWQERTRLTTCCCTVGVSVPRSRTASSVWSGKVARPCSRVDGSTCLHHRLRRIPGVLLGVGLPRLPGRKRRRHRHSTQPGRLVERERGRQHTGRHKPSIWCAGVPGGHLRQPVRSRRHRRRRRHRDLVGRASDLLRPRVLPRRSQRRWFPAPRMDPARLTTPAGCSLATPVGSDRLDRRSQMSSLNASRPYTGGRPLLRRPVMVSASP